MSLNNTLQIYEFLKTFARLYNLRTRYSVDQLHEDFALGGPLSEQIVVGLLDKFCHYYLIQSQAQSNSAFLNLVGQIKNQYIRRSVITLVWPTIFTLITRIYRVRVYLKDELEKEFQQYKDQLVKLPFVNWAGEEKQKFIIFLINCIGYESEFLQKEVEERIKLKEILENETYKEIPKKESDLSKIQQSVGKVGKKKQKEQQKLLLQCQQLEEELQLLKKATALQNSIFVFNAVVQIPQSKLYVFQDEKRAVYVEQNENFEQLTEDEMLSSIQPHNLLDLKAQGYFQKTKFSFQPIILDNTYEIEPVIEDEMNLEFFQNCNIDYVKKTLLALEENYSQYELNYWKSCWASAEKRRIWQERVKESDIVELAQIIGKIPHQLSWVNKKHGQSDPEAKFKSSRLYWFYQNKLYSQAYQQLSKQEPTLHGLYLLTITLYDKLKSYIHRKMRSMEAQSELDSTDEYQQLQK